MPAAARRLRDDIGGLRGRDQLRNWPEGGLSCRRRERLRTRRGCLAFLRRGHGGQPGRGWRFARSRLPFRSRDRLPRRRLPRGRRVALRARKRERSVAREFGAVEVGPMAVDAHVARVMKHWRSAAMAIEAPGLLVCPGERPERVVEMRGMPGGARVTDAACRWLEALVHRVFRRDEVRHVAGRAAVRVVARVAGSRVLGGLAASEPRSARDDQDGRANGVSDAHVRTFPLENAFPIAHR
jgi:hypothetical protein